MAFIKVGQTMTAGLNSLTADLIASGEVAAWKLTV